MNSTKYLLDGSSFVDEQEKQVLDVAKLILSTLAQRLTSFSAESDSGVGGRWVIKYDQSNAWTPTLYFQDTQGHLPFSLERRKDGQWKPSFSVFCVEEVRKHLDDLVDLVTTKIEIIAYLINLGKEKQC